MASYQYQCDQCTKTFETQGKVNRHLKTHSKPYQCGQCERGFGLRSDLNRHINARHRLGLDRYQCRVQFCTFSATRKDNLQQHLRKLHGCKPQLVAGEEIKTPEAPQYSQDDPTSGATLSQPSPATNSTRVQIGSYAMMYQAATAGNIPILQASIDAGLRLNFRPGDDSSALHCAARAGQTLTVRYLLTQEVDINFENAELRSPLAEAILSGNPETVICLLDAGAVMINDTSIRHCLAQCGSMQILKLCLAHVRTNVEPYFVYSILDVASKIGHTPTAYILLSLLSEHGIHGSNTAEDLRHTHPEIHPQTFHIPWAPGTTFVRYFTPMHHAAMRGNLEIVQMLAEHQIDFNLDSRSKRTPLHLAARGGHVNVVKYLLNLKGADVNCTDSRGATPLHFAAERGMDEVVRVLLHQANIQVGIKDENGQTSLQFAALNAQWGAANILLDFENGFHQQHTASQLATTQKIISSEVMERLTQHRDFEDINFRRYRYVLPGEGVLHTVITQGDCSVLKVLLAHEEIDVNLDAGHRKPSPLELAVELGRTEATKILLQHRNIDVSGKWWSRGTLKIAREKGHSGIVDLLLAHGAKEAMKQA